MSDIKIVVDRIFKTDDGKILLDYLSSKYYDCKIKNEDIDRQIGRRDVILFLKQLMGE